MSRASDVQILNQRFWSATGRGPFPFPVADMSPIRVGGKVGPPRPGSGTARSRTQRGVAGYGEARAIRWALSNGV
jgi:hypothetical protein